MFILNVANRRSTPVGAKVNVSQICEQRDFFGSVEIYCGLAFVYYCILRQSSTLIVHFYFVQVFLYVLFITEKNQKVPAQEKSVDYSFAQELQRQHPSVAVILPFNPFR